MIMDRLIGMITDSLELTADRDAPAVLTALAKAKNPRKNKSPNAAPNRNDSTE